MEKMCAKKDTLFNFVCALYHEFSKNSMPLFEKFAGSILVNTANIIPV